MSARVLLAEKSSTMRKIVRLSLQALGDPEVVETTDGNEALRRFEMETFHLVLTDWDMPGKSGLDLLKAIRSRNAGIPVIMMTSDLDRDRLLKAIDAGATDYIVKPFTAETRIKLEKRLRSMRYDDANLEPSEPLDVERMNPFLTMTVAVFDQVLGLQLQRGRAYTSDELCPAHKVTGVIDINGRYTGKLLLSLSRELALNAARRMTGSAPEGIDEHVVDVVGELANMIAGNAQPDFEAADVAVGLPQVIWGAAMPLALPAGAKPACVPFDSPDGPLAVQVGLVEQEALASW